MPNDDYVKRENIFPAVTEIAKEIVFGNQDDDKVAEIINSIPAADVELVRHGKWIEYKHEGQMAQYCSECGGDPGVIYLYGRCPTCGAYMDAKRDSQ